MQKMHTTFSMKHTKIAKKKIAHTKPKKMQKMHTNTHKKMPKIIYRF